MMPDSEETASEPKYLPINHIVPDNLRSSFVNHTVIQHTPDGDFYVSFFEIGPQFIALGNEEERRKKIDELESVDAHCVSRIVLNKDKIPSLIAALAQNYQKYTEKQSKTTTEPEQEEDKHAG